MTCGKKLITTYQLSSSLAKKGPRQEQRLAWVRTELPSLARAFESNKAVVELTLWSEAEKWLGRETSLDESLNVARIALCEVRASAHPNYVEELEAKFRQDIANIPIFCTWNSNRDETKVVSGRIQQAERYC